MGRALPAEVVKAISLWQPWASLIAVGAKRIETRSWPAPPALIGERIAIHAAKTREHVQWCDELPFSLYTNNPDVLPYGAVIAIARLSRCTQITTETAARLERSYPHEHAFGDYTAGRYAWVLDDIKAFPEPIPFTGRQRIFDVPADILGLTRQPTLFA